MPTRETPLESRAASAIRDELLRRFPLREPIPGRVVVVGVCASGKSGLVVALQVWGYDARSCAQEHSYVSDMWQRLSRPQALIYLDAHVETVHARGRRNLPPEHLAVQRRRLAHARSHCDLYLPTDPLSLAEVAERVRAWLNAAGISPF